MTTVPVHRLRDGDYRDRIPISVVVVVLDADDDRGVFVRVLAIRHGHRSVVRRYYRHSDGRLRCRRPGTVANGVVERIGAAVVCCWRVANAPVRRHRCRAVGGLPERVKEQLVTVGIRVVGQYVDLDGDVLGDCRVVGIRHRGSVWRRVAVYFGARQVISGRKPAAHEHLAACQQGGRVKAACGRHRTGRRPGAERRIVDFCGCHRTAVSVTAIDECLPVRE